MAVYVAEHGIRSKTQVSRPSPPRPRSDQAGGLQPTLPANLGAASAAIAATQTLAEWRAALTHEIVSYLPGCACTIQLLAEPCPPTLTPGHVLMPLWCDNECLAHLTVRDPLGRLEEQAQNVIGVLAVVAALRLAQLPNRITTILHDSQRELSVLRCLQELGRALSTGHDLQLLLNEVVRLAAELTEAETATLMLDELGGHGLILAAEWGHAEGPRPRCYLGRWGMADQVISSGQIVLIDHAPTDSRYAAPAFGAPCQSLLGVPLRRGDRVIGALNVTNHSAAFAFHQSHIDLLATIASYAAMGIEVAGLLEEREEQIRQLRYLHQQAPTLIRAPILPALFHDAARMAADLLGTGQIAIYVPGGAGDGFTLVASAGLDPHAATTLRDVPRTFYDHWQGSPAAIDRVIGPLRADPYAVPEWSARCRALDVPAMLVLPLVDERAGLFGFILGFGQHRSDFSASSLAAGRLFANQLTAALRNAQLTAEVRETRDYLQALVAGSGEAIITVDPAGTVLSWNPAATMLLGYTPDQAIGFALAGLISPPDLFHPAEVLAQTLRKETVREFETLLRRGDGQFAEVLLTLSPICGLDEQVLGVSIIGRDLEHVRADLKQSVAEVVRRINALRPLTLGELGLVGALRKVSEEFTISGRLRVEVSLPAETPSLPPQVELTVFRVAQEALNNVVRQSGADSCWLTLQVTANEIVLSVQDNGTGVSLAGGLSPLDGPHNGPSHVRERIEEFGGVVTIISTPRGGTQLVATVPRTSFRPYEND